MAVERYKTAGKILTAAGKELGLGDVADPFASSDETWQQLTQMLTSIGRELADTYLWENLVREHTIPTVALQSAYDLPADYLNIVDDTIWDRTTQQPLLGPLTPQEWQQMQSGLSITVAPRLAFRLTQNQLLLAPTGTVPGGHTLAFEMKSLAWVRAASHDLGNGKTEGESGQDECVAAGDWALFDPLLLQYALKLWWRKDHGFDVAAAEADFTRALENAKGRAQGSRTLHVGGGRRDLFLSGRNLPWP